MKKTCRALIALFALTSLLGGCLLDSEGSGQAPTGEIGLADAVVSGTVSGVGVADLVVSAAGPLEPGDDVAVAEAVAQGVEIYEEPIEGVEILEEPAFDEDVEIADDVEVEILEEPSSLEPVDALAPVSDLVHDELIEEAAQDVAVADESVAEVTIADEDE